MKGSGKLLLVALAMTTALQCRAADFAFSSRSDFSEMNLQLKQAGESNPQFIDLQVTLSPEAQRRFTQVTREEMHQPLRLFINGVLVSTATIQSVISGPSLRIVVPSQIARDLLPSLLEPPIF
ncbi:hypothetical protein CRX42_04960 [Pseudomonas jessenii]|uniref:SecDF P1 head subdomain domain-containing protein n=1 Tax=Pseudomonas jessenii TaxID=77298 RepID=A0A2W0ETJ3_PSEJE|nr:hypothetical protein [Pseudomonas jessenii]PYY71679.1 hypothetical protein CRX42_04960 [Pseudomonas jessenii]